MKASRLLAYGLLTVIVSTVAVTVAGAMYLARNPVVAREWRAAANGADYIGPNPRGILQKREYDCGPAALQIALLHFGMSASLSELGRDAGTTNAGTSMLGLKTACERRGVVAEGWKLTDEALQSIPLPAIAQVDGDHFIVIRGVDATGIVANDPAVGTITMTRASFRSRWSGYMLTMKPEGRSS